MIIQSSGVSVSAVANGAEIRVATYSSASALNGEANLTFDGSTLTVAGDVAVTTYESIASADVIRKSQWVMPHFVSGTGATLSSADSQHNGADFADEGASQNAYMSFAIPTDFNTLQKAVIVVYTDGSNNDARLLTYADFGGSGESKTANQDSIAEATHSLTQNQLFEYDVSAGLTGIAAGDYVGFQLQRNGSAAADTITTLRIIGMLLEWT